MNAAQSWMLILAVPAAILWAPRPADGQEGSPPSPADTVRLVPATASESLLFVPLAPMGERWSLAKAIQTALERNADVRIARARTRQASGAALSGWSGIIPSVRTEAAYEQVRPDQTRSSIFHPVTGQFIGVITRQETASLSASASSNIVSAPAIGEKRRLDHLNRGTEFDEQETRNQVVYRVKQQYFELVKAERLARVALETERLARDEETRAEALFQVGTVARGDVLKGRARRATTQLDRIRAENQVEIQASKLRQLLGIDPGVRIAPEPVLQEPIVIPDSSDAIRSAVAERPRLESAKAAERAARSGVFAAKSERLPKIAANLFVGRARIDENVEGPIGDADPYYATTWYGDLRATLPLFEGLAIEGGVRAAKGSLLEAESLRRQQELDVAVEVQQAWLTLRESVQRIEVAREGVASAEEDHKFSKGRYELGAGTYLDLLTAAVSLATARQRLIESIVDARIAEAGLEYAIGAKRY